MNPPPKNLWSTRLVSRPFTQQFHLDFQQVGHRCCLSTFDCIKRPRTLDAIRANQASSGFVLVHINLSCPKKKTSIFVLLGMCNLLFHAGKV